MYAAWGTYSWVLEFGEIRNIAPLNICHGISKRVARGMQPSSVGKGSYVENNSLPTSPRRLLNSIKTLIIWKQYTVSFRSCKGRE